MLAAGAFLVAVSLLAGTASVLFREGRLPGLGQDPTSEAKRALARGDRAAAIREFRGAAVVNPLRRAALDASEGLAMAGDFGGAGELLERERRRDASNADVLTALGWVLLWQHRLDEGERYLEMAVRRSPRDGHAFAGLGEIALEQDRYRDAVSAFQRALEIEPTEGATHNSLGIALVLSGNREAAIEHFAVAVRLTGDPSIAKNLERAREGGRAARHGR
jgi:tetratricopeptide (TPR) repeat protein